MATANDESPGLFRSARRVLSTTLAVAENRLELFLVELREERFRILNALLLVGALVAVGFLALIMVTLTLVVAFWDTARLTVLITLSLLYLATTAAIFWQLKLRISHWPTFQDSLAELKKDRSCLDEKK